MAANSSVVWSTKLLTIAFGVVQIVIGIWAADFDKAVISNALAIAGFSSGLLLGLFAVGTLLHQANQTAAILGLLVGSVVLLVIKFGIGNLPDDSPWSYQVAWPWFPVIGAIATFSTAWVASVFTSSTTRKE